MALVKARHTFCAVAMNVDGDLFDMLLEKAKRVQQ
jgi:hypothetical protein